MRTLPILLIALAVAGCGQAVGASRQAPGGGPNQPVAHSPSSDPAGPGGPASVTPSPGGGPFTPIHLQHLRLVQRGGHVLAIGRWWSGVAPCSVLRPVGVSRHGSMIVLRMREGSDAGPTTACIEIAMLKRTAVDLGALGPGHYTVTAGGKTATIDVA
jgi:hypothetical protein